MDSSTALAWAQALSGITVPATAAAIYCGARAIMVRRGMRTDLLDAAARGAALGYAGIAAKGLRITDPAAVQQIIAVGIGYVKDRVPDAVASMIPTNADAALGSIVHAELGKLLANDPSVAVGGGSVATATAAPGQSATAEAGPARLVERVS